MENSANKNYIIGAVVVALVVVIIGFMVTPKTSNAPGKYDDFAKCLTARGLTMYGAVWCSHCQSEKARFGDSFKYATYVECPDNLKLCEDKKIIGFPTWIDSAGKLYEGEQGLDGLAKISGCELP